MNNDQVESLQAVNRVNKPGDDDYEPGSVSHSFKGEEFSKSRFEPLIGAKPIEQAMIKNVAENGGEYTYKTVKGKVQDVHHTTAEQLKGTGVA